MSQWRDLSPQELDQLMNRQLGDASPTIFPAYRVGGSPAHSPDVRASLARSMPLFQSLSLNDVREVPIERSVSPWAAPHPSRHSFDGYASEQRPEPQFETSPEFQKPQPFRSASSPESGDDRLQSIKRERRRIQNRNAQNTYRRRQQDLVSGLQDDNLRVRAENERLKKENRELRITLKQISSVTLSLQYWLDGGIKDKGGCLMENEIAQMENMDGSPPDESL